MKFEIFFTLTTFAITVNSQSKYCQLPCDFGSTVLSHTVCDRENVRCGPHPRCGNEFKVVQLNNQMRQYILDLHNYLRNKVAMGNETRGNQPPAANMHVMTYNRELEYIAQCWANACQGRPLQHDHCRRTEKYEHVGQNLGFINSSSSTLDVKSTIKDLIMYWYNEVAIFKSEWIIDTKDRGPQFKVGHYTQMLWADTTEVGCAVSYYTTKSTNKLYKKWNHLLLVCNYGPGGNYLGLPVYEVGKPASGCNNKKNKHYRGLCGENTKTNKFANINTFDI